LTVWIAPAIAPIWWKKSAGIFSIARPRKSFACDSATSNQEAGDDRGEDALFGLDAGGDREGHRQRQRDHADRDAGGGVAGEVTAVVAAQRIDEARAEDREIEPRRAARDGAARTAHLIRIPGCAPLSTSSR
jgi:hypothetical protein